MALNKKIEHSSTVSIESKKELQSRLTGQFYRAKVNVCLLLWGIPWGSRAPGGGELVDDLLEEPLLPHLRPGPPRGV